MKNKIKIKKRNVAPKAASTIAFTFIFKKNKRFLYENTENQSKYKGKKRNVRLG